VLQRDNSRLLERLNSRQPASDALEALYEAAVGSKKGRLDAFLEMPPRKPKLRGGLDAFISSRTVNKKDQTE
jgi:hypothetical protein